MNNIYILAGEELILKDLRMKELYSNICDYDCKSIYIEPYRSEKYDYIIDEINLFLGTYDFFSSSKVLKVIVQKPEQINNILSGIDNIDEEHLIIFDLRCPEFVSKKLNFKYRDEIIPIERFNEFKDYEIDKVFDYIDKLVAEHEIKFTSEKDKQVSYDYIFNNAQGSYSFIYNELNKIKILNEELDINKVTDVIGSISNKNNYKTVTQMFEAISMDTLISSLESNLSSINRKSFIALINILISKIKDYIMIQHNKKCINKANYYTFKDSKLIIVNPEQLIKRLNSLLIRLKDESELPIEEFIWSIIEYTRFK